MKKTTNLDHLLSILALPFMVTVIIPIAIYHFSGKWPNNPLDVLPEWGQSFIGGFLTVIGLSLFIQSVILFIKIGRGTLAPWHPTKKLVIKSLYRHLRNPMILGVFLILLAEGFSLNSPQILLWALLFILINHFYFMFKEEPDLEKRFGEEYLEYKRNVPRWIPRLRGWRPEGINERMKNEE